MSLPESTRRAALGRGLLRRWGGSRWAGRPWTLAVGATVLGVVVGGAAWIAGHPAMAIFWVVLLVGTGVTMTALRGRSEAAALLAGEVADERHHSIQLRAMATTGGVMIWVLVVAYIVAVARNDSGDVTLLGALCAVAAVTWVASLVRLSRRG